MHKYGTTFVLTALLLLTGCYPTIEEQRMIDGARASLMPGSPARIELINELTEFQAGLRNEARIFSVVRAAYGDCADIQFACMLPYVSMNKARCSDVDEPQACRPAYAEKSLRDLADGANKSLDKYRMIAEEKEEEKRLAEKKVRYECGRSDEFNIYMAAKTVIRGRSGITFWEDRIAQERAQASISGFINGELMRESAINIKFLQEQIRKNEAVLAGFGVNFEDAPKNNPCAHLP